VWNKVRRNSIRIRTKAIHLNLYEMLAFGKHDQGKIEYDLIYKNRAIASNQVQPFGRSLRHTSASFGPRTPLA
jgi:hypothetical protein